MQSISAMDSGVTSGAINMLDGVGCIDAVRHADKHMVAWLSRHRRQRGYNATSRSALRRFDAVAAPLQRKDEP